MPLDIERGIFLGQALALRVGQCGAELDAVLRHRGEDRIAGAVDDSISRALAIAGQRLAQRADDRHTAADAGLETDRQAAPAGLAENLAAMLREQSLVRGNDVLARPPEPS